MYLPNFKSPVCFLLTPYLISPGFWTVCGVFGEDSWQLQWVVWGGLKALAYKKLEFTCVAAAAIGRSFCCWSRRNMAVLSEEPATCAMTLMFRLLIWHNNNQKVTFNDVKPWL